MYVSNICESPNFSNLVPQYFCQFYSSTNHYIYFIHKKWFFRDFTAVIFGGIVAVVAIIGARLCYVISAN